MVAEGLYRQGLDALQGTLRSELVEAELKLGYGQMLSTMDKRKAQSDQMIEEAQEVMKRLGKTSEMPQLMYVPYFII